MRDRIENVGKRLMILTLLLGSSAALAGLSTPAHAAGQEDDARVRHKVVVRGAAPEAYSYRVHYGQRTFLGVELVNLTPELREHFGAPEDAGVMVSRVAEDSPADSADIEVGDIISSIDGSSVEDAGELAREIRRKDDGDTVSLEIWRGGTPQTLEATLAERKRPEMDIRHFHMPEGHEGRTFVLPEIHLDEPIVIETEAFNEAIERLNEQLESPEWQDRVRRLKEHQHGVQERMEELEQRLRELEKQLEELSSQASRG